MPFPRTILLASFWPLAVAAQPVTFNEHVRPILANHCLACHGTDAAHRKGDRRIDTADGATAMRDGVRAIVPGDLSQSELWQRIISPHEDEVMPPPDSPQHSLKPEQREIIKRWIEQGATYQNHWAFEPVVQPPLPPKKRASLFRASPDSDHRPETRLARPATLSRSAARILDSEGHTRLDGVASDGRGG